MKKITLFLTLILISIFGQAQTTLAAGDIAFVLINATDNTVNTPTANDNVSFVLLKDISSGTKIYFTDFGWRSDAAAFQSANPCGASTGAVSDGIVEWTATSALTYGTVVHMNVKFTPTVNIGTITGYQATFNVPTQFVSIATSSEAVFAYQGSISSPTLITGVNTKNAWATTLTNCEFNPTASTIPSSLTTGLSALCWSTTSVNGILNSSVVLTGNRATDLANIYNPANWTYHGSIAFPITSYTVTATPVITSNPANRTICDGGTTTFSISASDATDYQWQVNTGSGFVNVSNGVSYSGATSATLSISSVTAGMNGYLYRCVATGSTSVNSNSGTLTVSSSSAPTASAQTFCSGATVADLAATGTSLKWYSASSGGSALATSTTLNSGTYYVSQTLNSCESTRTPVSVTINTTPLAPTASAQTFCSGATVADLAATGTSLKWYSVNSGGSALATSMTLNSGTYYVSQTLNSCESTRTSVVVTVTPSTSNTTTEAVCTSYTWSVNGTTYTTSGTYTSVTGCATEILELTITDPPTAFTSGSINYLVTSPNTVSVGPNGGASGDIVIPESVTTACGSYSVTSIINGAFNGCSGLTTVTIPNSVTSIGSYAFANCSSLTSVTLPNTLTSISTGLFSNSSQLSSISIPNTVTSIDNNAFFSCASLTSVTLPNSVTSMGEYVFQFCTGLTSVSISNSLTSIENFAFYGCTSLTSVIIPNSVTSIGNNAFQNCYDLSSVTLSNSLTSIGNIAFLACSSLTSITIPNSVTSIGNVAFLSCTSLSTLTIGNSVTSIGGAAFANCPSLTSVICNITSPITIDSSVFGGLNQAACSLAVPNGSVAAYQSAAIWQNFAPIFSYSKVIDSQCGATLPAINTLIRANAITGASHYRFKVVNGTTTEIIEPTSGKWFRLTSLPGGTFYNTTYTISVAVKKNNVWGEYGDACAVTTPIFPVTKVQTSQCGSTLSALNSLISANAVTTISGYRFKVVNGESTEIIESSYRRWFRLTSLPGGALYNTTYTISVATKYNGVWGEYGDECTITTPAFPLTKVQDSQCGTTLASITTFISADAVNGASGYRFKVVNQTTEDTIEAVSGSRWFRLTSLSGGASYNTTYTVSVATRYNGVWSEYGEACLITTPAAPLTKLQDRQCGITLNSGNTDLLYANPVSVAQKYRFEVSLGADVYTYDTASSSVRSFRMTEVPGLTLVNGTTYAVKVAIMANDEWQPYGESCTITTFGDAPNFVKSMNVDTTNFNVLTYPNPFTENFNLNLTSLSVEKVSVMVYDMTGKLLERKEVAPSELSELQVGTNFASGVYNVIVSQGENTKSIRVIKK